MSGENIGNVPEVTDVGGDGFIMQIRFDGPPGPEAGRFVEVENMHGKSFNAGEWVQDGEYWLLKIRLHQPQEQSEKVNAVVEILEDIIDYDAGLMNDYGGGNVSWWFDYIRAEVERANGWWRTRTEDALNALDAGEQPGEPSGVNEKEESMIIKSCKSCHWIKVFTKKTSEGNADQFSHAECRRHAPHPVENVTDAWPFVQPDDSCGEWEAINE